MTGEKKHEPPRHETLTSAVERHVRSYMALGTSVSLGGDLYGRVVAEVERVLLHTVLDTTRGNQVKAAMILGLHRNTLRKKIKELNIILSKEP